MRLIDADALDRKIVEMTSEPAYQHTGEDWLNGLCMAMEAVNEAPTVDALPLHCRIGDTVWVVGTKCLSGLYEAECVMQHESCIGCPLDWENIVFRRTVRSQLFAYIHDLEHSDIFRWGKTVFKTKEEAEAALAKMKGGEGND